MGVKPLCVLPGSAGANIMAFIMILLGSRGVLAEENL